MALSPGLKLGPHHHPTRIKPHTEAPPTADTPGLTAGTFHDDLIEFNRAQCLLVVLLKQLNTHTGRIRPAVLRTQLCECGGAGKKFLQIDFIHHAFMSESTYPRLHR